MITDGAKKDWMDYFPYDVPRLAQETAISAILDSFEGGKKVFILEAGTGVGKSAIGLTAARALQDSSSSEDHGNGSYFLTTQKVLQEQYVKDFGTPSGCMKSIKSSRNYTCAFNTKNSCAESMRTLRAAPKGTPFWKKCVFDCTYKNSKKMFIESPEGVTNFPYFLTETQFSGKIKPRKVLVVDEAHNAPNELSKFIEISISERFTNKTLKLEMPDIQSQNQAVEWIKKTYLPHLKSQISKIDAMIEKYESLQSKLQEFAKFVKQYDLLDNHISKIERFIQIYDKDNWVFNVSPASYRQSKKLEFKPIDVSFYASDMLFNMGEKIILMSATILDPTALCEMLGLDIEDVGFISIPSPFPVENRPVLIAPVGKMSAKDIDSTLPNLTQAVKSIIDQHKDEKGIIHCHTFKIANYLKKTIRSKRVLIHNSDNREKILEKHLTSKQPTVLLSPSMTEGVDLHGDRGRFQIICKVPFPYLGDKLIRKKMNKWNWWYPLQTAKTIVQAVGRSVRSDDDHAVTYILDSDWGRFYSSNKKLFPPSFHRSIV